MAGVARPPHVAPAPAPGGGAASSLAPVDHLLRGEGLLEGVAGPGPPAHGVQVSALVVTAHPVIVRPAVVVDLDLSA